MTGRSGGHGDFHPDSLLVIAGAVTSSAPLSRLFYQELPTPPGGGAESCDYLVPYMLNDAGLPTVLIGVVLVLLVAASVSTLASITITASLHPRPWIC